MRICLYTGTALPKLGGQEMVVDALARHLLELGHEPVVLAPRPRRPVVVEDHALPYPVERHPRFYSSRYFVGWYRHWLLKTHRRYGLDVLHCHSVYPCGYLAALCRARIGVPTVITSHGGDVRWGNARLAKPMVYARHVQALAAAEALVAISRFTAEGYARLCPVAADRIVRIPNGVDLAPYASLARRPEHLPAVIKPGRFVLFLGRLHRRKGVDVLLDAWQQLPATLPHGTAQLVVAGDGEEQSSLAEQARQCGIANQVCFVGRVAGDAKTWLLQNALVLVMPSREWEAFPLVLLEAQAAGTPVVGTRIPGLEDLVVPGHTGWLVDAERPAALAATLAEALDRPDRTRALGDRARAAAQNYAWHAITRRHVQLYEHLLAQNSHRRAA